METVATPCGVSPRRTVTQLWHSAGARLMKLRPSAGDTCPVELRPCGQRLLSGAVLPREDVCRGPWPVALAPRRRRRMLQYPSRAWLCCLEPEPCVEPKSCPRRETSASSESVLSGSLWKRDFVSKKCCVCGLEASQARFSSNRAFRATAHGQSAQEGSTNL